MEISNKITALRELHDLTQVQFGSIAGVSGAAVSAWELGDRSPKLGSIKKICSHFQIDLSRFVDDENNYYGAPEQIINFAPDSESGQSVNTIKIAGRDGSFREKRLDDKGLQALIAFVDLLPDAPDNI